MHPGVSFNELLRYTEVENAKWHRWLAAKGPVFLDSKLDIAGMKDLRGVLLHIFAVELRYAERIAGDEVSAYENLPTGSLDELFSIGTKARDKMKRFVAGATQSQMEEALTFETRSAGTLVASKRKCLAHALLHGIRHWAQIATALRQQGHPTDWQHDFIMSDALE